MQLITGAMISVLLVLQVATIGRAVPLDSVVYRCPPGYECCGPFEVGVGGLYHPSTIVMHVAQLKLQADAAQKRIPFSELTACEPNLVISTISFFVALQFTMVGHAAPLDSVVRHCDWILTAPSLSPNARLDMNAVAPFKRVLAEQIIEHQVSTKMLRNKWSSYFYWIDQHFPFTIPAHLRIELQVTVVVSP
ncbi:hypothetical protein F5887DRAFT_918072 [Amanita rubescens]|nr:hypothetical protein F5887DRAFT_918072 [Amanita rubescens]